MKLKKQNEKVASFARNPKGRQVLTIAGIAIIVVVIMAMVIACGVPSNQQQVDNATNEPTQNLTGGKETKNPTKENGEVEVSTPEPTAEPTATPIPEDWYIDPSGNIPPTVEILVPDNNTLVENDSKWCIARVDGKAILQWWGRSEGLKNQWEVPEDMIRAQSIVCAFGTDAALVYAYLTDNTFDGPHLIYYENSEGIKFYFEVTSHYYDADRFLMATTDGKAIRYYWGNDYYEVQDFGEGAMVYADLSVYFIVNGIYRTLQEMEFEKVALIDENS